MASPAPRLLERPAALAHRGFSGTDGDHRLENSLEAFAAAADLGYTWVETDVHATADGVLLAFHDETLDRTTDASGVIAQLPWEVVSQARIAGEVPIPRLDELFERWPRLCVNIDVKSTGAIGPLVACIAEHDAYDRVRIASFSDARRLAVLSGLGRPVHSSPGQALTTKLWVAAHLTPWWFARLARGCDALQIPERQGPARVLTQRLLRVAHRAGVEVHVWTVNDADAMNRLLDLGVDGLITDRADLLKDVLLARGEWA